MASKPSVSMTCAECGNTFLARKGDVNRGQYLCSKACRSKRLSKLFRHQKRSGNSGKPEHTIETAHKWFWPFVNKSGGEDACWPWTKTLDDHGYGRIGSGRGKKKRTHQIAFRLHNGFWAKGMVCHACDFKPCCNGKHLYDGTHLSNSKDRQAAGVYIGSPGIKNANAKLVDDDVIHILNSNESGSVLASRFGVTRGLIWQIKSGRAWKHIERKA